MSVNFGAGNTVISTDWTKFKSVASTGKSLRVQFDDDGILYTIFAIESHIVYSCVIWRGTLPDTVVASGYTQIQNDADKLDFETNFKPDANKPIPLLTHVSGTVDSVPFKVSGSFSSVNSTSVSLPFLAVFSGLAEDVSNYVSIDISVISDQPSLAGGLKLEWSQDNIIFDYTETFTVPANVGQFYSFSPRAKYFRLSYANGLTGQSSFSLTTVYYTINRSSYVQNLNTDIVAEKAVDVVRSVIAGQKSGAKGGNYTNLLSTDSGVLRVSLDTAVFPSPGATSIIQKNHTGPLIGNNFSSSFGVSTKRGNALVVALLRDQTALSASYLLSDSQANVYTLAASTKVSSVRKIDIWYTNSSGGPLTIQAANFSVSGTVAMQIYEVSGLAIFGTVVDRIATMLTTGTLLSVGPAVTTQNGEFGLMVYATDGTGSITPDTGWNNDLNVVGLGSVFSQVQSVAGPLTSSAIAASPETVIGVLMTFLPAAVSKTILTDADGRVLVSGSLTGTFGLSGPITGSVGITGPITGSVGITGPLTGTFALSAPITGTVGISAPVVVNQGLSGSQFWKVTGSVSLSEPITGSVSLSAPITGTVSISAPVVVNQGVSGAIPWLITGSVSLTSAITGTFVLAGAITGAVKLTEPITGSVGITGPITGSVGITSPVTVNQGTNPWNITGSNWTPTITGSVVVRNQVNVTGSNWMPTVFIMDKDGNGPVAVTATGSAATASAPALVVILSPNQQAIPVTFAPANASTGIVQGTLTLGGGTIGTLNAVRATTYNEQNVNARRSISSANVNDTAAGTGAQQVTITYYDASGSGPFTELISLSDGTAVNTVNTDICFIENMVVTRVGSGHFNAGVITLFIGTSGSGGTLGTIGVGSIHTGDGDNRTLWAHHYVAKGKTASFATYVNSLTIAGNSTEFFLKSKQINVVGAPEVLISDLIVAGVPTVPRVLSIPIKVIGPARVVSYGIPAQNNTTMVSSFDFSEQ